MSQTQIIQASPSSRSQMDQALAWLNDHKQAWVDLDIDTRIELVEKVILLAPTVWGRWIERAVEAKGIGHRLIGNDREWLEIATTNRVYFRTLKALRDIREHGHPIVAGGFRRKADRQVVAQVFPEYFIDRLLWRGFEMEVHLDPELELEEVEHHQARAYKDPDRDAATALVLGAGNASSLIASDVFHKLFHDLRVVILKMNPINDYLGPLYEEMYSPLIDQGFLRIIYGGAEEGSYLVHHDLVDEVHMTGSDRTFDAIVFGPGKEGRRRKEANRPIVTKSVQGELGCITPWIVVPGNWSEKDLRQQAAKMAFWMMRHEGYICFAPRLLLMHEEWSLKERFLQALIDALGVVDPILAYYPGSAETQVQFVSEHPEAIEVGKGIEGRVPWTVIPGLKTGKHDDICFRRESFSGLCGEVPISAKSTPEFLEKAVEFLNGKVWGTLSATLVVSEESLKDRRIDAAVTKAIADLNYGTVVLNGPGTFGFYSMIAPWGGAPGSSIEDIQSGNSWVANFLMLPRPQKTVVRAGFRAWPYPFHAEAKGLDEFCQELARYEMAPGYRRLPKLFGRAIRAS